MSPKTPRKPPTVSSQPIESITPPARQPDFTSTRAHWPFDSRLSTHPTRLQTTDPAIDYPPPATLHISEMPTRSIDGHANEHPVDKYWLHAPFLRGMQSANDEGWRFIVGRRFVDVEHDGGLRTAHVDLDEKLKVYRLKLLKDRHALGPIIYKNEGRPTWRLTSDDIATNRVRQTAQTAGEPAPKRRSAFTDEQIDQPSAAKQPRTMEAPTFIDPNRYRPSDRSPDAQGYYELEPRPGSTRTDTLFAFRDQYARWIQVAPPVDGFGAPATHLQQWTDHQIWQAYAVEGQDIARFRIEAQASGGPPRWAEPRDLPNAVEALVGSSLRWLHPSMTATERETFLQSYNLLPGQLTRLQQHLKSELTMPAWATAHKRLTQDIGNPHRLDQLSQDAISELHLKRHPRHDWYDPERLLTVELREALLAKLGYLRNQHNCLYRTDVPALFRGDERTPFELANDDTMLSRYAHSPGASTHKPMSATFSLKEGQMYASAPDPEYLRFNSQTNKYPGRAADDASPDSDAGNSSDSSASSDWSDAASPVAMDRERNYERTRERQTQMFIYALDTRGLEVVPHEVNYLFNSSALDAPTTRFPSDDHEGLISVTKKGLDAKRVWLLDSTLSKAANVYDIQEQAGANAERIEAATHAGRANQDEYDRLIDAAQAAGKPILKLSGNKDEFGDDITWPE